MKNQASFLLMTLLCLHGCGAENSGPSVSIDEEHDMVDFQHDDEAMNAAIQKARDTFHFFTDNWRSMPNDGCSLKVRFETNDGRQEHIWFKPTKIEGDAITGNCANKPRDIPGLGLGDERTFARSQVTDWMILVGNKCYGGYTIQVTIKVDPSSAAAVPYEFVEPD